MTRQEMIIRAALDWFNGSGERTAARLCGLVEHFAGLHQDIDAAETRRLVGAALARARMQEQDHA